MASRLFRWASVFIASSLSAISSSAAQTATIGTAVSPSAIDPQLSLLTSDVAYYRHIFDPLFLVDNNNQIIPGLATSYKKWSMT